MRDDELRVLERLVHESPDDPAAWARYVRALDQSGARNSIDPANVRRVQRVSYLLRERPSELPWGGLVEAGDLVLVEERDAPKILGEWRGRVTKVDGLFHVKSGERAWQQQTFLQVRPLALDDEVPEIAWRTSPDPAWIAKGLLVSPPLDRIELVARAPRPSTPHPPAQ